MTTPRALKIYNKSEAISDRTTYYIFNESNSTAIKVPKGILNTIAKIQKMPNGLSHSFVAILAHAIRKRRLEDLTEVIEFWNNSSLKTHHYPQCPANIEFAKLIDLVITNQYGRYFSGEELDRLVIFLAKCPHGYDLTRYICAHSEFNPLLT